MKPYDPMKAVCFTGHRPAKLGGYDESTTTIVDIKYKLKDIILHAIHAGYHVFISGMALGVDTWAAEIIMDIKADPKFADKDIRLIAAVPFPGFNSRWPQHSIDRYQRILDAADEIVYINPEGYAAWKLDARNKWMVEHAYLLIAVWNGDYKSGTYNCIRYAESRNEFNKIFQIEP